MKNSTALALFLSLAGAAHAAADPPAPLDAARRRVALEKLRVLGTALYVGAHPDDENTALLAYLANERKVRVIYLSLTRGDGGQNLIGTEQGDALGVIRTEELLAARAIDGAEQMFTRAIDFGYSKSAAETLRVWDRDKVLADVVWAIRSCRPDVVITRFPDTGEGGHGHHTASAILAEEAFALAGDPTRFPEQLAYVAPWQPKRLVWNAWRRPAESAGAPPIVTVDVGAYSPILGRSYTELAALSRSMHKSQGFGAPARRGPNLQDFVHVAGEPAQKDLFDGIDLSWRRIPGGEKVDALLAEADAATTDTRPDAAVPHLLAALSALGQLAADPLVELKRSEILSAIRSATGLWLEATSKEPIVTPGHEATISVSAVNRSSVPLTLARVELTDAEPRVVNAPLGANSPVNQEITLRLPSALGPSQLYWLDEPPANGTYVVRDQRLIGRPLSPPVLVARFVLSAGSQSLVYSVPVEYRSTDPVEGDVYRSLVVAPDVTVTLDQPLLVFPGPTARTLKLRLHSHTSEAKGALRLALPEGWSASPERAEFSLPVKDQEQTLTFAVTPPPAPATGTLEVRLDDGQPARALSVIDHAHIPQQTLLPRARARIVRLDLARTTRRVGYVMGAGDEVPAVLRELGMDVTLLDDEDLSATDLTRFDAIVTGVRAYNTRQALREAEPRLLRYVEQGGTLVVQYNTERDLVTNQLAPYELKLSHERVTDEHAQVRLLDPAHPLLRRPNAIQAADFDGWIQERGLYFPGAWDKRLTPLLAMHDEGEADQSGSLLVGSYGKGTYVYTGLAFFRQLPAGVPGALRLFVNLLTGGRPKQ